MIRVLFAILLALAFSVPASADHCTAAGCHRSASRSYVRVESHSEVAGVRGGRVGSRAAKAALAPARFVKGVCGR